MPSKKKAAPAAAVAKKKSQKRVPKVETSVKNVIANLKTQKKLGKPGKKRKGKATIAEVVKEVFVPREIKGRDEREVRPESLDELVEILGGEQPSKAISTKVTGFERQDLQARLAQLFTLNKQLQIADDAAKHAPDPLDRRLKAPSGRNGFESEGAILQQVANDTP
jgi:hypothetical protein